MAQVCGLHHLFYVLDSREASFQLVKRLWPNSAIQNESSLYRKSAGMAGSIRWSPFPSSYKPDEGSYGVFIGLGSPFSLHSPAAGGVEVFVFVTDSLNGNSIRHPPFPPNFFHSCISRRKRRFISRLFCPVASVMFTIDYLGQSSIFCETGVERITGFSFQCAW